jgi:hypothetical protein
MLTQVVSNPSTNDLHLGSFRYDFKYGSLACGRQWHVKELSLIKLVGA